MKSGSFDLGQENRRSSRIIPVGDGSVNLGFVEDSTEQNVSGDCGLLRRDMIPDGHPDRNEEVDNIPVMAIGHLQEPVNDWRLSHQCTTSSETKSKNISTDEKEEDKSQNSSENMRSADISEKTGISRLSKRDYLKALSIYFITFITYGYPLSLSVLTVEWQKEFQKSKSLILFFPNLMSGLMSGAGVIDGFLINRFGIHNIILLGGFIQISCAIGSSFSANAVTLVILLGLLLGFASCFCYVNCFILAGLEFGKAGKYLIAALSLASPVSSFVYPNLIPVFVEKYTWRGCMLMLAGINLQTIPFALFLLLSHKRRKNNDPKIDARTEKASSEPIPLTARKKAFDISLFKNPIYVAYLCAVTFTLTGSNAIYSLLASFFHKKGLSLKDAATLYSVYCVIYFVPRASIGFIQRWIKIPFMYIFIALSLLSGSLCILINQAESYSALLSFAIVLSLCLGGPSGLYSIGTLEIVGLEKYSFATSVIETSYGVATAALGYLAGVLVDYTDSYQQIFCIYGALIITSNLCLLITILVQYWTRKIFTSGI